MYVGWTAPTSRMWLFLVISLVFGLTMPSVTRPAGAAVACDAEAETCPVEPTLSPPDAQERVKDGDVVAVGGTVESGWAITRSEIRYQRADGSAARSPLSVPVTREGNQLGGEFNIGSTNGAARIDLAISVARDGDGETYRGISDAIVVDNVPPSIVGYTLVAADRVQVGFTEDVRRPSLDGGYRDNPSDWRVDGNLPLDIEGSGDRRTLVTSQRYDDGDRPFVEYTPRALGTYIDLAGFGLTGANRSQFASDGIPPEIPAIRSINGSTQDPVIGGSLTPTVRVGELEGAAKVQLWRDSLTTPDRTFEPDDDVLLAEVPVPDDAAEVTIEEDDYLRALPAGERTHTLFARSVDESDNVSAGVDDVRYDIDPTPPHAETAVGDGRFVTVRFSEPITGTNRAADWDVSSGGPVESVSGSGDHRVIRTASNATGRITWTPPTGDGVTPYQDEHGNRLVDVDLLIDAPGQLRITDASTTEGSSLAFVVTVARPKGDDTEYSVAYATEDGTAAAGDDYTARSGRLTFSNGSTSRTVAVPTAEDDDVEGSETMSLRLSNPGSGARLPDPAAATGTILDPGASEGLSVFDTRAHEGSTARAVVQLAEVTTKDVTVRWRTADGTAKAGSDYSARSGTLRIPAGSREGTVTVPLTADEADEPTETFSLELSEPVNATIQRATATVSILDGAGVAPGIGRVSGPSRVETSAAISKAFYASADTVVVATANAYPDALAGAPLAEKHAAPILLTTPDRLHPAITQEVKRLGATTALVLGGPAALSGQVDRDLRAAGVTTVRRLSGQNRFDTARVIAAEVGGGAVYVVEGANADPKRGWPDAVAVSALAAAQQRPILLVERTRLPSETAAALNRLSPDRATIVGGPAAVNDDVRRAVDQRAGTVDRVAGRTRYETSRAVASRAVAAGFDPGNTFFATGDDWPDSLSASPAVARTGGILLLVDSDRLDDSPPAREWLVTHRDGLRSITLIGGPKAISSDVSKQIQSQSGLKPR